MKVLIPQPITDVGVEFLMERGYEVIILDDHTERSIIENGKDVDAILARTAIYSSDVIESCKSLKVVSRYGVGFDNIAVDTCTKNGVWVCVAATANANAVAEHTITFILGIAKNLKYQDRQTREGNWEARNTVKGREVAGKTLGIIGCGRIGRLVAQKASLGLSMKIIGYDPYLNENEIVDNVHLVQTIDEIVSQSDYISLHIPATKDTIGFVDEKFFNKMKPTASLINCARGAVVNEKDLYVALKDNVIHAAALDVFSSEPVEEDNPLLTLDNILLSPHNASLNYETMDSMSLQAAEQIDQVLSGTPPSYPINKINMNK